MADNTTLSAGTADGAVIATDDISSVHYQKVKLVDGADQSTTLIGVDIGVKANAMRTAPANDITDATYIGDIKFGEALPAGTAEIGKLAAGVAEIGNVKNAGVFVVQEDGAALTALQIIDDWDESDRAKVNPIVGQAGVAAGAGAVGVTVQRTTLASDDPAVALLATIDSDTNTIQSDTTSIDGKLVSGTIIGDVNVVTVPRSISGDGEPGTAVDSYTHKAIDLTTGANQVLVASAPSKQIWVYGYAFTCGDADGQTVQLEDEDDVDLTGIMEFAQYGGISVPPCGNFSMPLFKLGTDKDLEIDITGGDVDGWLVYAILSV